MTKNDLVFISGKVGVNPERAKLESGSFVADAHQVMQNTGDIEKSKGHRLSDLENVTIYFTDMSHYDARNEGHQGYLHGISSKKVRSAVKNLPVGADEDISAVAIARTSPKEIVRQFLEEVRSGQYPEKAAVYMADTVLAHQVTSENPTTVQRTPANYAAHIREFHTLFGKFEFTVTELLAEGVRVYARWIQKGIHQADIDQHKATGLPLIEYTSAVYRIENGKIAEYWLQSDRLGLEEQLKKNALFASGKPVNNK